MTLLAHEIHVPRYTKVIYFLYYIIYKDHVIMKMNLVTVSSTGMGGLGQFSMHYIDSWYMESIYYSHAGTRDKAQMDFSGCRSYVATDLAMGSRDLIGW